MILSHSHKFPAKRLARLKKAVAASIAIGLALFRTTARQGSVIITSIVTKFDRADPFFPGARSAFMDVESHVLDFLPGDQNRSEIPCDLEDVKSNKAHGGFC